MEFQHFSHEHPLMLCDNGKYDSDILCYGCNLRLLSGDAYKCGDCEFIVHKTCAEWPDKIIHFLHPKHPLALFTKSPYHKHGVSKIAYCNNCEERIWGYSYHCSICKYDLDLKCVFLREIVKHEGHEHSFTLLRPTKFTCDACGNIGDDMSYLCTGCQLMLHKDCALVPPQTPQPDRLLISTKQTLGDEDEATLISMITSGVLNEISLEEKGKSAQLEHFSHVHPLTLNNDDDPLTLLNNDDDPLTTLNDDDTLTSLNDDDDDNDPVYEKLCDACTRPLSVPFYACVPCEYFLHFKCSQLPITTQNAHHPHRFKLLKGFNTNEGLFRCSVCARLCSGFVYACELCDYFMDMNCASLLKTNQLVSATHEHALNLVQNIHRSSCNACGQSNPTALFRCDDCNFNLDLECAALPMSARHGWDEKHLLKLTTVNIEHVSNTYFCDLCEEDRDPKHWYYSCKECDLSFHPRCLFGSHNIKYGKKARLSFHRDHDVYFVEKMKDHLRCKTLCGLEKTDLFVYECRTCNYHCHLGCSINTTTGRVNLLDRNKKRYRKARYCGRIDRHLQTHNQLKSGDAGGDGPDSNHLSLLGFQ